MGRASAAGWAQTCRSSDVVHATLQQFKNHSSNPNLLDRARWRFEGVCHKKKNQKPNPKHVLVVNLAIAEVANCREVVEPAAWLTGTPRSAGAAGQESLVLQRAASRAVWETLLVCSAASGRGCKPPCRAACRCPAGLCRSLARTAALGPSHRYSNVVLS